MSISHHKIDSFLNSIFMLRIVDWAHKQLLFHFDRLSLVLILICLISRLLILILRLIRHPSRVSFIWTRKTTLIYRHLLHRAWLNVINRLLHTRILLLLFNHFQVLTRILFFISKTTAGHFHYNRARCFRSHMAKFRRIA